MHCVVFLRTMLLYFVLLSHLFVCLLMPQQDFLHQTPLLLCRSTCMFLHNDATNAAKRLKIVLLKAFVSVSDGNKSTCMKKEWKLSLSSWWPEPREQKSIENIRSMAKTDFVNESRGLWSKDSHWLRIGTSDEPTDAGAICFTRESNTGFTWDYQ